MTTIKTEGSAWHWQAEDGTQGDSAAGAHPAAFARLMERGAKAACGKAPPPLTARGAKARYRLVGGRADGLICDVSDGPDGLQMCVIVPEAALFHRLNEVVPRLAAVLGEAGYRVSLEVHRAEPGA
ncbi:hypothetical protein [Sodalis sp.]|uniref:hypothetical protein n=1 Tax=Sodalis sp. (in: enterobacteria) TaxID=1898979 RepID=UPI0038733837